MKAREFIRHHYPVRIVFCPDRRSWSALLRSLDQVCEHPSHRGSCTHLKGEDGSTIAVTLGESCLGLAHTEVAAVAAHEAVHVAQYVEEVIEGPLGREPHAYLVQAIVGWLLEEFERVPTRRGEAHGR
ncbi:MAG TPA: hypothetical protein PK095_00015 [Myxococcota bacterium]|nr:hypothetical protein [Myxococcota bacterium]